MKKLNEYPQAVIQFVEDHYKKLSDTKLQKLLIEQFPDVAIHSRAASYIRKKYRLLKSETKTIAFKKAHELRSPKIGAIIKRTYHGREQWMIKIDQNKYRQYATYLYKLSYGKIPFEFYADWIDDNKPLVKENLHLLNKKLDIMPVGAVTKWLHDGKMREFIKTGSGKYELYLTWLWRKHYGQIPEGKFVSKISPNKESTIDNLQLVDCAHDVFRTGARSLEDWFVISSLTKMGFNKKDIPEPLIKAQRSKIELKREIKKLKNATDSTGAASDPTVEGTPTENA